MSDLALILAVAAVTYATRVAFLIRPRPVTPGLLGRFLNMFPLALFIAIATAGLAAPDGNPQLTTGIAAAIGGAIGAVMFRRSLWGVLGMGALFFYVTRALTG